ncbi:MAG: PaaI family thioesterase [Sphingomonadales bacterium]|nr:PaaI family thioesterase [Sphingomonadales bacterium]
MRLPATSFSCIPDPENPGWLTWDVADKARFNAVAMGRMLVRKQAGNCCRLRMFPGVQHANLPGSVHGGVILALADVALFATIWVLSEGATAGAVTLDLGCQFIDAGELEEPMDAVTELLKETRRLSFLRGTIVQGERIVASYSATMRKSAVTPSAGATRTAAGD